MTNRVAGAEPFRSSLSGVVEHHRHPLEELPAEHAVLLYERPFSQPTCNGRHIRLIVSTIKLPHGSLC